MFGEIKELLTRKFIKFFLLTLYKKEIWAGICKKFWDQVGTNIQHIPTWLFVTGSVIILSLLAIWVEDETNIRSIRDVVKIIFKNADSIALVAGVILYFKEIPERKAQKHYEAWQVIDNAAAAKVPTSYARFKALEELNQEGVMLNGVVMPEANLQGINLKFASLFDANLTDTDLSDANLQEAKLFRANLTRAKLSEANLVGADITGANLTGAKLNRAKLTGAKLAGAKLTEAKLAGADLRGASLTGTDLRGANLLGTNLSYASFFEANLTEANFSNANLTEVKFFGANLAKANFVGAIGLSLKEIKEAKNWQSAIYTSEFSIQLGLPELNRKADDIMSG
ncbi:pentapeptide repeat-containing protein [Halotia branconii]|uniref:Pentapeptide repeat-containing protein n=1 Tax=Halotia branconii CENA392 TaxID=1539056 RepID=A0AAJ6NUE7_9CYAN|nr:pentapeptide repeat-containing protein [Halotia branconii]WGV26708.1 pentapeptide repeat-containing protein [Halotia branconii CENA392]